MSVPAGSSPPGSFSRCCTLGGRSSFRCALAILLSLLLWPAVRAMRRIGLGHVPAVLLSVLVFALSGAAVRPRAGGRRCLRRSMVGGAGRHRCGASLDHARQLVTHHREHGVPVGLRSGDRGHDVAFAIRALLPTRRNRSIDTYPYSLPHQTTLICRCPTQRTST